MTRNTGQKFSYKKSLFKAITATLIVVGALADAAPTYANSTPDTFVTISGRQILINGQPTYTGANPEAAGRLCVLRAVNTTTDDMDGSINPNWNDSGAPKPENDGALFGPWNAEEHTDRFIESLSTWRASGVLGIVLNPQGGCQCDQGIAGGSQTSELDNNPYGPDGNKAFDDLAQGLNTPHARYLKRIKRVIEAADDLGMVVILQLFYFG